MKSGQQLVSEQNNCLLSPIEIAQIHSSQQALIESAVQNINLVIEYINHYRFRPPEYGQCYANMPHSKQSLAQDIELREKIAKMFIDNDMAAALRKKIKHSLRDQQAADSEVKSKIAEYDAMFDEFIQHAPFIHLTAGEVAAIGVTLDNLIALVRALLKQVNDAKVKTLLEQKQNEFIAAREKISACMNYHLKTYKAQQQSNYSDMLLSYQNMVQQKMGVALDIDMQQLWPDMSILMPVPLLPFDEPDKAVMNVKEFFEGYIARDIKQAIEAPAPALLPQPEAVQENPSPTVLGKALEITGWCATGVGSAVYTVATAPVTLVSGTAQMLFGKAAEPSAPESQAASGSGLPDSISIIDWEGVQLGAGAVPVPDDKPSPEENEKRIMKLMDDMMGALDKARHISEQSLEEFRELEAWRAEVEDLQTTLKTEIDRLKRSCFSCLFTRTINLKRSKSEALGRLLSAVSLDDLQHKVQDEQQDDPNHQIVLYGSKSRTRALLEKMDGALAARQAQVVRVEV